MMIGISSDNQDSQEHLANVTVFIDSGDVQYEQLEQCVSTKQSIV